MDLNLTQVDAALADPAKKDEMVETLMSNIRVLEDENGEIMEVIPLQDVVVTPSVINQKPGNGKLELRMRDCANLVLRDDDVLVISYPKTGTHWVCNLIHYMLKAGPLEEETSYQPSLIDMFPPQMIDSLPSPRVLATHHKPGNLPKDVYKGRGKLILVFRNPKDAAVSQFYQYKKMTLLGEMKLSWSCFVDNWMKGLIPPTSFFDFYNTWQEELSENKDLLDVLVVHYEDMKKNGVSELRRMNKFLGLEHSDDRLQHILDKCSINILRADVDSGKVKSPLVNKEGKSILYRKGVIGDWKNHFTVAQNETIDELIAEQLKDSIFKYQC